MYGVHAYMLLWNVNSQQTHTVLNPGGSGGKPVLCCVKQTVTLNVKIPPTMRK